MRLLERGRVVLGGVPADCDGRGEGEARASHRAEWKLVHSRGVAPTGAGRDARRKGRTGVEAGVRFSSLPQHSCRKKSGRRENKAA